MAGKVKPKIGFKFGGDIEVTNHPLPYTGTIG
jgi:hypothetical protein